MKVKDLLKEPKPKTIWDLEDGDNFYWIAVEVSERMWENSNEIFLELREAGYVFLTYEEASKELKRKKIEALLKKYANGHVFDFYKDNYVVCVDIHRDVTVVDKAYYKSGGDIYFSSRKDAEKAVQEIGKDRLLRDYFQVEMDED